MTSSSFPLTLSFSSWSIQCSTKIIRAMGIQIFLFQNHVVTLSQGCVWQDGLELSVRQVCSLFNNLGDQWQVLSALQQKQSFDITFLRLPYCQCFILTQVVFWFAGITTREASWRRWMASDLFTSLSMCLKTLLRLTAQEHDHRTSRRLCNICSVQCDGDTVGTSQIKCL